MVVEFGVALVWFDFDFDFVGCRGCRRWGLLWFGLILILSLILWVAVILIFFFVLEADFGFQLIKVNLGTEFWR